jgi:WhiB family redox-sensing transcriptional regulator
MSSTTVAPAGAGSVAAPVAVRIAPSIGSSPVASSDADWTTRAACLTDDPDELFVRGAEQNRVKARCLACVVRTECLADALDNRVEFGVWGGMTERERRALLRRRPDVVSWRTLLERARQEHVAATSFGIAG